MNCKDLQRLLDAHVDMELDLATALDVEAHLAECKRCRLEHARVRATRDAVRMAASISPAPPGLRRALHARYGPREGTARRWTWLAAAPGVAALLLAVWLLWSPRAGEDDRAGPRVVYHVAQASNASAALRNLANHLETAPRVQAIVVAHNNGVEFLLQDARDEDGRPYREAVQALVRHGVQFRVCTSTLTRRQIAPQRVIPEAMLVPSGIAEIARLQTEEGYAYMRL